MKNSSYLFIKRTGLALSLLLSLYSCKKVELSEPVKPVVSKIKISSVGDLDDLSKKDIAMTLISSAENSTKDWRGQYGYIEDINDGRGYTAGIIGFTTSTDDILNIVTAYSARVPGNVLEPYIPALTAVRGSGSHQGLDPGFPEAWKTVSGDDRFKAEQDHERDNVYFLPAVKLAKDDGLHALGQFIYFDAAVVHGYEGLEAIRRETLKTVRSPSNGENEETYLDAFLNERVREMQKEAAHHDVSRIEDAQRVFLKNHNLDLNTPLSWKIYGEAYEIQ